MPSLKLHFSNGSVEVRELSRRQPLSIGRQAFNDVSIDEEGVGTMHCRVSWNKTAFEVAAGSERGVEVNGVRVARMMLTPGDVIRVGSVDLDYIDAAHSADPRSDDTETKYELAAPPQQASSPTKIPPVPKIPEVSASGLETKTKAPAPSRRKPPEDILLEDDAWEALKSSASMPKPVEDLSLFDGRVVAESQEIPDPKLDGADQNALKSPKKHKTAAAFADAERVAVGVQSMSTRARPGEQDIVRSPLVIGLASLGLLLLLVTGIFWFLISREQSFRLYDRAVAESTDGKYAQAIASFEEFIQKNSSHSLRRFAERGLDKTLVQKEISGGSPAWKRGLEKLKLLISNHRKDSDFADLHSALFRFGEEISLGSAKSAESTHDADLLIVSDEACAILERYAEPTTAPTGTLTRIKLAKELAEKAIEKQKTFEAAVALMDAALAAGQPMTALSEREKLIRRFPEISSQKRVKEVLQKALDLERSVIAIDATEIAAETDDDTASVVTSALSLFHTRLRTEETSQDRFVYVSAKDCCYAVDTGTGETIWRRIVGFETRFFPILATGSQPSLLIHDARRQALLCCRPDNGKLIWRHQLAGKPRSAPLVQEGQIYLATEGRLLNRIALDSGTLTATVRFSQDVIGPPAVSHDAQHLLIPGEMAMIYSLTLRPLAAAAMTFTDHAAGSIEASPLGMGRLLLLCENDKSDSAHLRIWDADKPSQPLPELNGSRVVGTVRDLPVIRGNQLVVASSNEHLAAFSVTDEPTRVELTAIGQYRVKGGYGGATYVALGPDQQLWSASSAFRRFDISADSIRMDPNATAEGIACQPLQISGQQFFVGRKASFHDAVIFSAVDRERMLSPWRTVLGAEPLEVTVSRDPESSIIVNEAGQIVSLGATRLKHGGIELKAATELDLPKNMRLPLFASRLHDGRIAVIAMGGSTSIWILNRIGQTDSTITLANGDTVEAPPVLLDEGLVLPLSGRLKWAPLGSTNKAVQDWIAPTEQNTASRWRYLLRLTGNELIACDDTGRLRHIQKRKGDRPYLAEISTLQLDVPIDVNPALNGDELFVVDSSGTLRQFKIPSFDVMGERTFVAPVRSLWVVGNSQLVWSGDDILHAVSAGKELSVRWSLSLANRQPAGSPVMWQDQLWLACRDGTVLAIDMANGHELQRLQQPQVLSLGLQIIGDHLFAIACDGTMYQMESKAQP
jgi:outer membrane protein assembly factor BamB